MASFFSTGPKEQQTNKRIVAEIRYPREVCFEKISGLNWWLDFQANSSLQMLSSRRDNICERERCHYVTFYKILASIRVLITFHMTLRDIHWPFFHSMDGFAYWWTRRKHGVIWLRDSFLCLACNATMTLLISLQEWSLEEWNKERAKFAFLNNTLEIVVVFAPETTGQSAKLLLLFAILNFFQNL